MPEFEDQRGRREEKKRESERVEEKEKEKQNEHEKGGRATAHNAFLLV